MSQRPLFWLVAVTSVGFALAPRSIAHAEKRIYLPFALGPACSFESPPQGPTPGPLPTLAVRRWQNLRPANDVQAMARDERTGEVWSAGHDGVARWSSDAKQATSYTDADGLPQRGAVGVATAPNGTVWTASTDGSYGDLVSRLRSDGRWVSIASPVDVKHIAVDRVGGVWVGGDAGAARLAPDCGWEYPLRGFPLVPEASVVDILAASNGDVWLVTSSYRTPIGPQEEPPGVAVRRADGAWRTFDAVDGLRTDRAQVADLAEAPDGRIWALFDRTEYSQEHRRDMAVIDVLSPDDVWEPAPLDVRALADLADVTRQGGAVVWDAGGRPWFRLQNEILVPDDANPGEWLWDHPPLTELFGMPAMRGISALTISADGVAWVGTGDSMFRRFQDGTWRNEWMSGPQYPPAVAVDHANVWMDTLHRSADGVWEWLGKDAPAIRAVLNDMALVPDGVWFALDIGLVHRASSGVWTQFTDLDALGGRDVSTVVAAADGSVWAVAAGDSAGMFVTRHRPDGRWEPHSTTTGLPSGTVRGVAVGGNGAVWVGIQDGTTRHIASLQPDGSWTDLTIPVDLRTGGILQMAGDASGALWLFSTEHGLMRRASDGGWDAFTDQPVVDLGLRFPNDRPHVPTLAIAPDGSAWIGGRSGEVRVRRPDGEWRSLMLLDGAAVRDIAIGPDGRAWMTMADGSSPRVVDIAP